MNMYQPSINALSKPITNLLVDIKKKKQSTNAAVENNKAAIDKKVEAATIKMNTQVDSIII
jgi:hypothetical protein